MVGVRKSLPLLFLLGAVSGCVSHFSTPLDWRSLKKLEDATRDRTGSIEKDGQSFGPGHSFTFSPRRISFVSDDGTAQDVALDSPVTLSIYSRMAGRRKGFWIGFVASAGVVLVTLLDIDGKDTGEITALPLVLGGVGLAGGSIGALIGASFGGTLRFEIGGS